MYSIVTLFGLFFLTAGCQSSGTAPAPAVLRDTLPPPAAPLPLPKPYQGLVFQKKEVLTAAGGTKSVLFNPSGTRLYAMNLEGMSVYEFEQASRKLTREFRFTPTRGTGWDYNKSRPIASFQEKPVEACFSHGDSILWVSLHNADGIVPLRINDYSAHPVPAGYKGKTKPVTIVYPGSAKRDSFRTPLIETGKTPKVIARTADNQHLLVSNWHSRTTSVLRLDAARYPWGEVIRDIKSYAIPRGIAVDDKGGKSYIAIMGGSSLQLVDNQRWDTDSLLPVGSSPRHVVMDTTGHLFVSFNSLARIACLEAGSGRTLFTASTHAQPRTIVLSKNQRFLFVTCYSSDYVDVYKIHPDRFEKIASLSCPGHPVGVDVYEDDEKLEAWVCSYSNGAISIYTFKKTN